MEVSSILINTHKYDFHLAKICIGSIRYWYPEISIYLIKDFGSGNFSTKITEQKWNVGIFKTNRKRFGWGYGKLEPLFSSDQHSFLILDADTVLTGPVLQAAEGETSHFIVDNEVQPSNRFNEIYYDLGKIKELEPNFVYPGYSFNTGQWFGTSAILDRKDFQRTLDWTEPPKPHHPNILFNGDQGILNFVIHCKEQTGELSVARKKIMLWPNAGNTDFLELSQIKSKKGIYPYVIHWAGIKSKRFENLPRADILYFYKKFYYSRFSIIERVVGWLSEGCIKYEKLFKTLLFKVSHKLNIQ